MGPGGAAPEKEMTDDDPRTTEGAPAHAVETPPDETPGDDPTSGDGGRREHGVGRGTDDAKVPVRVFAVIAVAVAVLAAIYAATAYEAAGTVMLVVSVALVGWPAAYVWLQVKRPADAHGAADGQAQPGDPEPFQPHASVWPFAIGAGAFLLVNGFLLGPVFIFPGAGILVVALGGFVRQSRHRD